MLSISRRRWSLILFITIFSLTGCIIQKRELSTKQATLKEELHTMREAIDQYTQDRNKAPQGLTDLIQAGYLRAIPVDPFTNSSHTWQVSQEHQIAPGITDVHSGSDRISSEGTPYSSW